jgi:flagellar biosynthesis protein FliR
MLVVVPATYYFVYWVPFSLVPFLEQRWIPSIISLLCAMGVGRYVWRLLGSAPTGLISSTLFGAVVLGAIGFCAGFFGPMIFTPGANQGPLLGIFITGPLGFVLGGVGGFAYGLAKKRSAATE